MARFKFKFVLFVLLFLVLAPSLVYTILGSQQSESSQVLASLAAPMLDEPWTAQTRGFNYLIERAVINGSAQYRWTTEPPWVYDFNSAQYVPYLFEDHYATDGYYQVRSGIVAARLRDYVTVLYDVNVTEPRAFETWLIQRRVGQIWLPMLVNLAPPTWTVLSNSSGIFLTKTQTRNNVGILQTVYSFQVGMPLKHTVTFTNLGPRSEFRVIQIEANIPAVTVSNELGQVQSASTGNLTGSVFDFHSQDGRLAFREDQRSARGIQVSLGLSLNASLQLPVATWTFQNSTAWTLSNGQALQIDPDSSTKSTTTWADDATVGTLAWTNPANAQSSNNVYATATVSDGSSTQTHYDKGTAWGFSITGTVDQITVSAEKKCTAATGTRYCTDGVTSGVRLLKGGSYTGGSCQDSTTKWATSDTTITYCTGNNLWGATWTASDINGSGFGVGFSAQIHDDASGTTASLDYISITVYYSPTRSITWALSGVGSDAQGTIITIDSTAYVYGDFPKVFSWVQGSTHSVAASTPINAGGGTVGKRYAFSSWTNGDGLSGASGTYTTPTSDITVTAIYVNQFKVTYTSSGISTDTGSNTVVTVDSVAKTQADLPFSSWYTSGSNSQYAFSSPVSATSSPKRYPWSSTSGLSQTLQSNTFAVTVNGTVTGTFTIEYQLGITLNGYGTSTPTSGGWYASGANVQVTINSDSSNSTSTRHLYNGATGIGSGSYTGSSNPFTVTINSAVNESIAWKTQYHLVIRAVDKYNTATILSTTKASMNVTNGGSQILFANATGYMDFGWKDSGTQSYITAKYSGTVANSTWHTSLYTINSASVYQWNFKYDAYVTILVSVPTGEATDATRWNYTSYYVNSNSSATFSSGTARLYYGSTLITSQAIGATFSVLTATGVSITGSGTAYMNVTDGYIWTRTTTSKPYSVTATSLAATVPTAAFLGQATTINYAFANPSTASTTYVIITNAFVKFQLLNASSYQFYTISTSLFNAAANAQTSDTFSLVIPTSVSASNYVLRIGVWQRLLNGTDVRLTYVDKTIAVFVYVTPTGSAQLQYVYTIAQFQLVRPSPFQVIELSSTEATLTFKVVNGDYDYVINNIAFLGFDWITVNETFPMFMKGADKTVTIHILISAPNKHLNATDILQYVVPVDVKWDISGRTLGGGGEFQVNLSSAAKPIPFSISSKDVALTIIGSGATVIGTWAIKNRKKIGSPL